MQPILSYINIPTFGSSSTIIPPPSPVYTNGFQPGVEYPAENQNYFINGFSSNGNNEQTMINSMAGEIITYLNTRGITPSGGSITQLNGALVSIPSTSSQLFQIDSGNSGPQLNNNSGTLEVRNSGNTTYAPIHVLGITATTFSGTTISGTAITGTSFNGMTISSSTGTFSLSNSKTLTVTDSTTLATNSITFGGGEALTLTANKNVTFTGSFITSGVFDTTMTLTGTTSVTLPTSGTLVSSSTAFLCRTAYQGLLMTYVSTTSFSVGAGVVGDSGFAQIMYLSSTLTKTTSAWAVGSGNGGLNTGAIAATTWYYVYLIMRTDLSVVDVLFSTSSSSPTMPTNYTYKRLIGAVLTDDSSHFVQWIMYANGEQYWVTLTTDVNTSTLGTSRTSFSVPSLPAIPCSVSFNAAVSNSSANVSFSIQGDSNLTDSTLGVGGPVTAILRNPIAGVSFPMRFTNFYFATSTLYAKAGNTSSTLVCSVDSFNVRPYN